MDGGWPIDAQLMIKYGSVSAAQPDPFSVSGKSVLWLPWPLISK